MSSGMHATAAGSSAATTSLNASTPLLATGDWTKNLVHLAKTAELKKHALTLQLHTAHILSAHASLDHKNKSLQDLKEQKNKLESERTRLLNCLREVNEDRDKANDLERDTVLSSDFDVQADITESTLNKECEELRRQIQRIADGDYARAKDDVDRLRQELGQPPVPSLQQTLEERSAQYLKDLRIQNESIAVSHKRNAEEVGLEDPPTGKRPRGRPKGSKNSKNKGKASATPTAA